MKVWMCFIDRNRVCDDVCTAFVSGVNKCSVLTSIETLGMLASVQMKPRTVHPKSPPPPKVTP
jgi:hypothetical protein